MEGEPNPQQMSGMFHTLDMSDTVSTCETDGFVPVTSTHTQVVRTQGQHSEQPRKEAMEAKMEAILNRIQQDKYSLDVEQHIPRPKAYNSSRISTQYSLSGSELGDSHTGLQNITDLSEGQFIQGLETSIEVLHRAESTQSE